MYVPETESLGKYDLVGRRTEISSGKELREDLYYACGEFAHVTGNPFSHEGSHNVHGLGRVTEK